MNILVWGVGLSIGFLHMDDITIIGYVESMPRGAEYNGLPIYSPVQAKEVPYDYIAVATEKTLEIYNEIIKADLDLKKIIFKNYLIDFNRESDAEIEKSGKNAARKVKLYPQYRSNTDLIGANPLSELMEKDTAYRYDYSRFKTFELIADRINKDHVVGDVAEFGVFRGVFAALINKVFHNRTLYLFDSFEGFRPEEATREVESGRTSEEFVNKFKNTSVEYVMSKMPYPQMIDVRKGFFPETTVGLEEKVFCFVSLDADFEESILEGLRYFYPRMSDGGVIMLHDYSTNPYVQKAVERYESENKKMRAIPLSDNCGTLIIMAAK